MCVFALDLVDEQVLGDDYVAFHAHHFGDVGDLARAIAQARGLHDDVDRTGDHLADGARGQRITAHGDHRFNTRHGFAWRVRVQRAHRAVVAGVHSLQQVERLGSAYFADDDPLRSHTQAVAHQVAHSDLALAFGFGRAGCEADCVRLLELDFGRVLAGDNPLVVLDELGEAVEQRGLAGAGTAGHQRIDAAAADNLEDLRAFRRDRVEAHQLVERQLVLLELTNGEGGAVDGERRHDHVDAGAVRQARVADRRGFVDAAADLTHDALADVEKLLVVAEADAGLLDLALDFDVGGAGAVHHDVGDVVSGQQRLERPVAKHVVADVIEQLFLLSDRHHDVLDRDDLIDDVADFLARGIGVELGELREVDGFDQRAEDRALGLVVMIAVARIDGGRRERRLVWQGIALARGRRADDRRAQACRRHRRAAAFDAVTGGRRRARGGGRRGLGRRLQRRRRLRRGRTRCGRGLRRAAFGCGTLSEHVTLLQILQTNSGRSQARFSSLPSSGENRPGFSFLVSERPVNSCASWRNDSAVRWLADNSAIIWPLLAAAPNTCGSNGMTATG